LCVIRSSHERNGASPQERVLADVLGLVGADDPRGHAYDDGPMAVDELLERGQLPARRARDELGIVDLLRRG
jgi:hypothetical protein